MSVRTVLCAPFLHIQVCLAGTAQAEPASCVVCRHVLTVLSPSFLTSIAFNFHACIAWHVSACQYHMSFAVAHVKWQRYAAVSMMLSCCGR